MAVTERINLWLVWILSLASICSFAVYGKGLERASQNDREKAKPRLKAQLGHSGEVRSANFSPDGRHVLTASRDKTARLWEVESGREVRSFVGHSDLVWSANFSPDGRHVLTASSDSTARLWEVESGREVRSFPGDSSLVNSAIFSINSANFSPDGSHVLTASGDSTARLWEVASGREVRRFEGHSSEVNSANSSPDGSHVLTASSDKTARLWKVASGREIRSFVGHSDVVRSAIFSSDGRQVLTASDDNTARLWEVETGREVRRFDGHSGLVWSANFSPDGRHVLTASGDSTACLWEVESGREVRRFLGDSGPVISANFSPDGRHVLTASLDSTALWEVASGREVRRFEGHSSEVDSANFSPDGRQVLTASSDKTVRLWEVESGREVRSFIGHSEGVTSAIFSSDGRQVLTASWDKTARLWEVETGQEIRRFVGHSFWVNSAIFSSDGRQVLTASWDKTARLWEVESGREARRFVGHSSLVTSAIFSSDGRNVLTASWDRTARLWEVESGREVRSFVGHSDRVGSAIFSPDGRHVLTASGDRTARLWEVASGREVRRFERHSSGVDSANFSPDGRHVLTASSDKTARLWEVEGGRQVRQFVGHSDRVGSANFSSDGKRVLTASSDRTARLWEVESGREVRSFEGHSDPVFSVTFSPDGRQILTASSDSTARLWEAETGKELCQLISFRDGTWAVVDPEGRFDTNNLEEIKGLHWIMPDDPMKPLPLEIFMRDYYEPRLLPRILAGEQFKPVNALADLNRVQPTVKNIRVIPHEKDPFTVNVQVDVSGSVAERKRGKAELDQTEVYDLRLFRDGQIVGSKPGHGEPVGDDSIESWRARNKVSLGTDGRATVTFPDIKLSRIEGEHKMQLTAYAFNRDRVKSKTAVTDNPYTYTVAASRSVKSRAYIISVGVNTFDNENWNLQFAANDARLTEKVLYEKLGETGQYEQIVPVALVSDAQTKENRATKATFKAVLDVLSGKNKNINRELIGLIPNAHEIREARPEDLIVISFSSHGYADSGGNFYLFPSDIGKQAGRTMTDQLKQRLVSSEELALWLRDVDAGEMVMIVDACHSAAAVEGSEFKPGPMGSRGLGQLAYDKKMRILAATRSNSAAIEVGGALQQGLLSYALTKDGLEQGRADFQPAGDLKITVREWLEYGVKRVPQLYTEVVSGTLKAVRKDVFVDEVDQGSHYSQQPSLFDFSRGRADVTLANLRP